MNANRHRGEIVATLDGKPHRLCLTLGALAELEDAFAASDLTGLVARFSSGRLSAGDMVKILGCGLRGGGSEVSDEAVRSMRCDDGAAGFARIVADLLTATFGRAEKDAAPVP